MRAPGFEPGSLGLRRVLDLFVKVEGTGKDSGLFGTRSKRVPPFLVKNNKPSQGLSGLVLFKKIGIDFQSLYLKAVVGIFESLHTCLLSHSRRRIKKHVVLGRTLHSETPQRQDESLLS